MKIFRKIVLRAVTSRAGSHDEDAMKNKRTPIKKQIKLFAKCVNKASNHYKQKTVLLNY